MITAVVVDDVQKNVLMLVSLLRQYCPQVALAGTANSSAAGAELIKNVKPQLVFLDIEMPYGSGFDMLKSLNGINTEVIFITAYDQYAIDAFRCAALDYLLKPVNIEELEEAVNRAEKRIKEKDTASNYELLLRNLDEKDLSKQTISLTENGQQYLIQLDEIKYIIAEGSYTHIYATKKTIVSTKKLKDFEGIFPATAFCRIHNGHIVNKMHIARIQKGRGGSVFMKDGRELEIAVRRKEEFMKMVRR